MGEHTHTHIHPPHTRTHTHTPHTHMLRQAQATLSFLILAILY